MSVFEPYSGQWMCEACGLQTATRQHKCERKFASFSSSEVEAAPKAPKAKGTEATPLVRIGQGDFATDYPERPKSFRPTTTGRTGMEHTNIPDFFIVDRGGVSEHQGDADVRDAACFREVEEADRVAKEAIAVAMQSMELLRARERFHAVRFAFCVIVIFALSVSVLVLAAANLR